MISTTETNEVYHANPAYSSSEAKVAEKSMQLLFDQRDGLVPRKSSTAFNLGSACHTKFLEPHMWDEEVVVRPADLNLRTKDGKQWMKDHEHLYVITEDDARAVRFMDQRMPDSIRQILEHQGMQNELTVRTQYKGLDVQCRFDGLINPDAYDLKTTAKFDTFDKDALGYGYDLSAGWYDMVWQQETHAPLRSWTWVVCETVPPYRWALIRLPNAILERQRIRAQRIAESIRAALDHGVIEPQVEARDWRVPNWHPDYMLTKVADG